MALGLAIAAVDARAQAGASLVTEKGCMACHAVDQRKMGPSFKDIAAKYIGDVNAQATVVAKLRDGMGHPKVAASEIEIQSMVGYVLSTATSK